MEYLSGIKNTLKKKMMQVVVKTTLGRFLKSVTNDHIRNVTYFESKVQFELQNLDIKESVINEEIISDTPFRLLHGSINSISGDVALASPDARSLRMEGLHLVFYVNPNRGTLAALTPEERRQNLQLRAEQHKKQVDAQKNALFSSMLVGSLSKESLQQEILEDVSGATADDQERAIDESVDALSNTIKGLVHSFQATIVGVNIRIIVPPRGVEISDPRALPSGCVELAINLEKEIQLLDSNSACGSGNSFHKRIRFSGIRLMVFDAGAATATETETEVVEQLDIADTIISGDVTCVENELDLQFFDGDQRQRRLPRWATKLSISQVHAVFSPAQLTRFSQVMDGILAAPQAEASDSSADASPPDPSRFTCTCTNMSLTILQPIDEGLAREVVRSAWRSFRDEKTHIRDFSSMPPHYAIECSGTKLLLCTTTVATNPDDDPYHRLFEEYGGRYLSVGLRQILIAEKRSSDVAPTVLVRHGAYVAPSQLGGGPKSFNVVFVLRSTCPLSPAVARGCGVSLRPGSDGCPPQNIVRHDILLNVQNAVEFFADVEIADRLLAFSNCVQKLVAEAHHRHRHHHSSLPRVDDEEDDDVDDLLAGNFQPVSEIDVSALEAAAAASAPKSAAPIGLTYDDYTTITVEISKVQLEMRFPASRRPDASVYGPLAQRLFRNLCSHLGVPLCPPVAQKAHITKGLQLVLDSTKIHLPNGDSTIIQAFMSSAAAAFVDFESGEPPQLLARFQFAPPDEGLLGAEPPLQIVIAGDDSAVDTSVRPPTFSARSSTSELSSVENGLFVNAVISVAMTVRRCELWLHQDDYLLLMFMMNEMIECLSNAVRLHLTDPRTATSKSLRADIAPDARFSALRRSSVTAADSVNSQTSFYTCNSGSGPSSASSFVPQRRDPYLGVSMPAISAPSAHDRLSRSADSVDTDNVLLGEGILPSSAAALDRLLSATAIRLQVLSLTAEIVAPRLSSSSDAIEQPLWMTLSPAEREKIDSSLLFHTYVLTAAKATVFVYVSSSAREISNATVNARAESLEAVEKLCRLPTTFPRGHFVTPVVFGVLPKWGDAVPLVRSFANLHNRSYNVQHPSNGQQVFTMAMSRIETATTVNTTVDVVIERVSAVHQAAHPGDHWLFVLMNFFSDNPVSTAVAGEDDDAPAASASAAQPLSQEEEVLVKPSSTRVTLTALNILLQYQPFGRKCKLVALVPRFSFDTGVLLSTSPRSVMHVALDRLTVFVHNDFEEELLEYDDHEAQHSAFGGSREGLASDLQMLGFVHVLSVASNTKELVKPNVIVRTEDVPGKPLLVEISGLTVELATANDSFYYFNLMATHFGAAIDLTFLPSPYLLVAASSHRFKCVQAPSRSAQGDPVVTLLVDGFSQCIESLLCQRMSAGFSPPLRPVAAVTINDHVRHADPKVRRGSTPPKAHSDEFEDIDEEVRNNERVPQWAFVRDGSKYQQTADGSIASLFANTHYMSAFNPERLRVGAQSRSLPLIQCPPVSVEIVVYDCHANVTLYGGSDFGTDGRRTAPKRGTRPGESEEQDAASADRGGFSEIEGFFPASVSNAAGRNLTEKVVASLTGVFLQVDLFEEGHTKVMQMVCRAKELEVLDCIETSPVRTLVMCSIPRNLRDRDGHVFEMKWTTVLPAAGGGGLWVKRTAATEEQVSIRLLPLVISIHRRALDLFLRFTEAPNVEASESNEPSTLFFNKIFVHPIQATINVYFEVKDYNQALRGPMKGQYFELANMMPQIEGSRLRSPPLVLTSFPLSEFAEKFVEAISPHFLRMDAIVLLLCGVQPVRTITETGAAATELVLAPLEHYKRNKSLFLGISKGLRSFSRRLSAEALRVASGTTRVAHEALHSVTGIARQGESLHRGSQPQGAAEGLSRAASELGQGLTGASEIVSICLADGHIERIPLALLAPIDGTMRALTQALLGFRNSIRPEQRALEIRMYKSDSDKQKQDS
jgi:hypothetical protein